MSQLEERIAQFRKMASDDPDNELGHFRLGQLLMEAQQYEEAVASFCRALEISPQFSKIYELLADCLVKVNRKAEAVEVLQNGWQIADERGDWKPREAMGKMLTELGETVPQPTRPAKAESGPATGFRCQRPTCEHGNQARQLPAPPLPDELGRKIHEQICADCWHEWVQGYGKKVLNELRLDLSTEFGQEEYDRYMRGFFGWEETTPAEQGLVHSMEYLVNFGRTGFLGRFSNPASLPFIHGDRVVLRTVRGLDSGIVLSEASSDFAHLVAATAAGDIVRAFTREDERRETELELLAGRLLAEAQLAAESLKPPPAILDIEMLLDGASAILHVLPGDENDLTDLAQTLSLQHGVAFAILDLRQKPTPATEGCGKPGCGTSGGGCSSCGSGGGGCSTGSCSRGQLDAGELTTYFANLRRQMEMTTRDS